MPGTPPLSGLRGYLFAALCVAVALVLRFALDSLWGDRFPFVAFFLAVLVVGQFAEAGPSIFSIVLGFVLACWFFVPPRHSLIIRNLVDQFNAAFFFFISAVVVVFSLRWRRALAREQMTREELRQHVEALRASEARYSSVVENSMDAILLTDPDGRVLSANREACRMFGRTEDELKCIGRTELLDTADQPAVAAAVLDRAAEGKVQVEVGFVRRDGTRFIGEVTSGTFIDRDGLPRNSSIIRDVTGRKRAEEALGRIAAIVESSDDAIVAKAIDGTILSWNAGAERLYGYAAAEAIGKPVGLIVPPERDDELLPLLERVRRGERISHFETSHRARDGRVFAVSLSISPVLDVTGTIVGASMIARDITERKRAEEEREGLVRELQSALANVKTLSGLLPICANCKKIRDDNGYWNTIELYIRDRSDAQFTHGICPDCSKQLYPSLFRSS